MSTAKRRAEQAERNDQFCGITLTDATATYKPGTYTLASARIAEECLSDIISALKPAQISALLGTINDLDLFLEASILALKQ